MLEDYLVNYSDKFGEEETFIQNDGETLRMTIRGIEFYGKMLDDWEPITAMSSSQKATFSLHMNQLHSYVLDFIITVPVIDQNKALSGTLRVHLDLGEPQANGAVDHEKLHLDLIVEGQSYKSCGKHSWFDDALQEIHNKLPDGMFIKSCFNCAFSDYSPAGYGLFGCMACFRNSKQEYLSLKGKAAFFNLQDKIVEFVQETYLCSEFEKRVTGTGYRG